MASNFSQYTNGVQMPTGISEAGANVGKFAQQGLSSFGASLSEGLQVYNENSQKSEAANAKIQMLGQQYADKIAMYAKDPEIAQSGILDSLMAKAAILRDAPTKGLSQRVMIAHEAETSLAGFGSQLQEMMFLRGREMERVSEEGLRKFDGFKSVSQAAFVGDAEFQVDLNLSPQEAQEQALAKLGRIRKSNPNIKGTDEEFLSAWRTAREQALAGAKDINPAVVSAGLEALAAERKNAKAQADALKKADISGLLTSKFFNADVTPAVAGILDLTKFTKPAEEKSVFLAPIGKTVASLKDYEKTVISPVEQVNRKNSVISSDKLNELNTIATNAQTNIKTIEEKLAIAKAKVEEEKKLGFFRGTPSGAEKTVTWLDGLIQNEVKSLLEKYSTVNKKTGEVEIDKLAMAKDIFAKSNPVAFGQAISISDWFTKAGKSQYEKNIIKTHSAQVMLDSGKASPEKEVELLQQQLAAQKAVTAGIKTTTASKDIASVPKIPIAGFQIGIEDKQRRLTVAERQREVADFVTSKMGAIDPTDPERKRRLPVVGFDKFYKSLVPEAEIREFTTDSGLRMVYSNGKWEQIKSEKPMTPSEIRKANIGVFGKQTGDGRLVPSEFIPDSGVYIGGLFSGTDAAVDKYQEEMPKLIDARRGVKVLREINDQMGESLSPTAQGRALVEEMNLSAMLRTDIVGVGTVSNYEQQLIKRVTENSTNFFSLEAKDRAILIALAERVDRRIKNLSAAHGLTVELRDDRGTSKYQALREQYLREKGIL